MKIGCRELGILDCSFTANGEDTRQVAEQMIEHLRSQHQIEMPDVEYVLDTIKWDRLTETNFGRWNQVETPIRVRLGFPVAMRTPVPQ